MRTAAVVVLLCFFTIPATSRAGDPRTGNVPAKGPTGVLIIVGGGTLPELIRDRFLELAGGKKSRIVIIPTASEVSHRTGVFKSFDYWKDQPATSIVMLHTMDRAKANESAFIKPLTEATGVWLAGGDQQRLTTAYRGTAVDRELHKLLDRGGVIGGTSAGAAAMSSLMIVGGNPDALTGTGFGLLPGVVIDQHFSNRNRLKRLQGVLTKHSDYVGLGIDEETAVVVKGRTATVLGNANVRVCLPPVVQKTPNVQVLKSGQEIDLDGLRKTVLASQPVKKGIEVAAPAQPRE